MIYDGFGLNNGCEEVFASESFLLNKHSPSSASRVSAKKRVARMGVRMEGTDMLYHVIPFNRSLTSVFVADMLGIMMESF